MWIFPRPFVSSFPAAFSQVFCRRVHRVLLVSWRWVGALADALGRIRVAEVGHEVQNSQKRGENKW